MMAGRGVGTQINLDGLLHDSLVDIYAQELGIPVDELNTRLDNGETLAEIAFAEGLTADEFAALMSDARSPAYESRVSFKPAGETVLPGASSTCQAAGFPPSRG